MGEQRRMAGGDAAWFRMDEPTNRMVVTAVMLLEGPVDWARIEDVIRERILVRYPPFRRRIVQSGGLLATPGWEEVDDVDLDAHIRRVPLAGPGDDNLTQMVDHLLSTPLDLNRPPWEMLFVDDEQGGGAVLAKLHHALADGIALAQVLLDLADDDPATGVVSPAPGVASGWPSIPWHRFTDPREVARAALQVARGAASIVRLLTLPPDPPTSLKGPLGEDKHAAWSHPFPLEAVKAAAKGRGATVNDLLLAAMAGALRRELAERNEQVDELRLIVPINLRPLDQRVPAELGNRFGLVFLALPVGIADPDRRLTEVQRRMEALKRSPEGIATFVVLTALGVLPAFLEQALVMFLGSKATAVMTNVRGPDHPLYLAGSRLLDLMFWVPQSARLGLGISILSHAGQVTVGVVADARLVPRPARLIEGVTRELGAVGVAPRTPAQAREP